MKIAQVGPLYEAVPPKLYGGTERVVAHLCDALVDLGHDVTLFSSADADTRAELVTVRDQAIRLDPAPLKSDLAAHLSMLSEVRRQKARFDIIHFHTDMIQFPMFEDDAARTVTTLHGRLDMKDLPEVYRRWPKFPLVSISNAQRTALPFANWAGTVYHGMPEALYRFSPRPDGYLAFLGRISPEKGPDRAIAIAKRLGMPLKIAAKVDAADVDYFNQAIRPLLDDPLIEFIGEIGDAGKSAFLGGAEALLFPIDWPEPFGLVMIEAMACGTPVVAYGCGSAPEVIDAGVTGFIVSGEEQAAVAVRAAQQLDRRAVRRRFDRRFSATAMARGYLDIYADRLAKLPYAPELAPNGAKGEKVRRRSALAAAPPPLDRQHVGLGAEPQPLAV
jgi:glycosyltransferase involved in cell wall biosynthesis